MAYRAVDASRIGRSRVVDRVTGDRDRDRVARHCPVLHVASRADVLHRDLARTVEQPGTRLGRDDLVGRRRHRRVVRSRVDASPVQGGQHRRTGTQLPPRGRTRHRTEDVGERGAVVVDAGQADEVGHVSGEIRPVAQRHGREERALAVPDHRDRTVRPTRDRADGGDHVLDRSLDVTELPVRDVGQARRIAGVLQRLVGAAAPRLVGDERAVDQQHGRLGRGSQIRPAACHGAREHRRVGLQRRAGERSRAVGPHQCDKDRDGHHDTRGTCDQSHRSHVIASHIPFSESLMTSPFAAHRTRHADAPGESNVR
jgi:hypothetical protein